MAEQKLVRGIAPSLFAVMIDAMGFGLVYPMMTAILSSTSHPIIPPDASIHLRHFLLGLGFLLYPLGMLFGASLLGDLSDTLGRKKILVLCMCGVSLSFLSMAIGIEFLSLFLLMSGRFLSGLMAGSQPIAQAAVSDLSTRATRALNMSRMTLALSVGNALGPFLGGLLSDTYILPFFTYSTPFYFSAILALFGALWILWGFKETFLLKSKKKFHLMRPIHIFVELWQNSSIRFLSITFLTMQIGFSLYFQLMPVFLHGRWNYASWKLGTFNGLIGVSFILGLLLVIKWALKYWTIEKITVCSLFLTGIFQCASALLRFEILQWVFAIPIALFDCLAYTGILTAYSKAVDAKSQGWAMGISGSVLALSWTLSGFSTNLITMIGLPNLILFGGVLLLMSGLLMQRYKSRAGQKR